MLLKTLNNRKKLEEIAKENDRTTYITYLDALNRYGLITEAPYALQCATITDTRIMKTKNGEIQFFKIPQDTHQGYIKTPQHALQIAEPEKALIDAIWITEEHGINPDWTEHLEWKQLDMKKIKKYASMMGINNLEDYFKRSRVD